jgi:zinc transport system substrate-binding protein
MIHRYQQADVILLNGAGYAAWVQQATLPSARLINTSELLSDRLVIVENSSTHAHGPEGKHAHRSTAFTTWLDPSLAILQAQSIRDALTRLRPGRQNQFEAGFSALTTNLDELDRELQSVFSRLDDRPVLFSHPVYQYLIRRYGINARSLHWEPDTNLTESDLADLLKILETHPATVMIWESEPADAIRETLESRGVSSIVFSTAANTPVNGDYLSIMRDNLADLQSAL